MVITQPLGLDCQIQARNGQINVDFAHFAHRAAGSGDPAGAAE